MASIKVTELRQYLSEYLKQVQAGQKIAITLHGKTIACIVPEAVLWRKANPANA